MLGHELRFLENQALTEAMFLGMGAFLGGFFTGFICSFAPAFFVGRAIRAKKLPECFGTFRSPQWDAEGDCRECEYDDKCYRAYRSKETK